MIHFYSIQKFFIWWHSNITSQYLFIWLYMYECFICVYVWALPVFCACVVQKKDDRSTWQELKIQKMAKCSWEEGWTLLCFKEGKTSTEEISAIYMLLEGLHIRIHLILETMGFYIRKQTSFLATHSLLSSNIKLSTSLEITKQQWLQHSRDKRNSATEQTAHSIDANPSCLTAPSVSGRKWIDLI